MTLFSGVAKKNESWVDIMSSNASLERPAAWYKKVNIASAKLAKSFYPKHTDLLDKLNALVQDMIAEISRVEHEHNSKILNFVATHQETLSEYARTKFVGEQLAIKAENDITSVNCDATEAIQSAWRTKRAEEITRIKACRDSCNISPENLKHLRLLLQLLKEGDDLDDIVYG